MKVLILGVPGSGKTYVSQKIAEKGVNALDADLIQGLSKWVDKEGNEVAFLENATKEWLDSHDFIWDKEYLREYLTKQDDIYIFGISSNVFNIFDLFDKVYYLSVPSEIIRQRLDNPERENPMGKTEEQKQAIIKDMEFNQKKTLDRGGQLLDGTKTPEEIYKIINSKS